MSRWAVVLAGGSGTRMGLPINKVLLPLRGIPVLVRAIAPFTGLCNGIVVVARTEERDAVRAMLTRFGLSDVRFANGGDDRQASVASGLRALPEDCDIVLVHDGARALVTEEIITRVLESVEERGSGVAAVAVTDTIKRAAPDGRVLATLDRAELFAMQTPQGFRTDDLRQAHALAQRDGYRGTDDAALLERAGLPVCLCEGSRENLKLTTPFDLELAETILKTRETEE